MGMPDKSDNLIGYEVKHVLNLGRDKKKQSTEKTLQFRTPTTASMYQQQ